MNIGENIAKLRKENNLTQEDLANLINVSSKTISSYETNRSIPNIEILILLSNVFNTNIDSILGLNKENKEEIKNAYHKKDFKDNLIKILIISLLFIIPIIFFWYAGYTSIAAFAAHIIAFDKIDITKTAKMILNLYSTYIIEYIVYLIILLINYILYSKKKSMILFVFNSLFIILILMDITTSWTLIIIPLILDIILYLKKYNKILIITNIIIILILFIFSMKFSFNLDIIIFLLAALIGIGAFIKLTKKNNNS